jgi:hypothetical protein
MADGQGRLPVVDTDIYKERSRFAGACWKMLDDINNALDAAIDAAKRNEESTLEQQCSSARNVGDSLIMKIMDRVFIPHGVDPTQAEYEEYERILNAGRDGNGINVLDAAARVWGPNKPEVNNAG